MENSHELPNSETENTPTESNDLLKSTTPRETHLFFGLNEDYFEEGARVEGVIVLVVQQEKLYVSKIGIQWTGKEFTNWYEGLKQDKNCTGERIIFDIHSEIWYPSSGSIVAPDGYFKKGTYTFPFSWTLPNSIPGSFVDEDENLGFLPSNWIIPKGGVIPKSLFGEKSYISYFGTAFLESEQYSTRLETVCVLKVLQKYDPNLLKPKPIEKNGEKPNLINFKTSMPLKMSVTLPNGGLAVAGYKFPIQVAIANGTNYAIRCIKISFRQNIVLSAPGSTFQRQKIVFEGEVPNSAIDKHGHYVKDLLVDVPSSIPQSILLGTLIQRNYEIIVELVISLSTNLAVTSDVKIFEMPRKPSVLPPGVILVKSKLQTNSQRSSSKPPEVQKKDEEKNDSKTQQKLEETKEENQTQRKEGKNDHQIEITTEEENRQKEN